MQETVAMVMNSHAFVCGNADQVEERSVVLVCHTA